LRIANTLVQTCKLSSVDPLAWLTNVLQRIVSCQPRTTIACAGAMELAPTIHRRRIMTATTAYPPIATSISHSRGFSAPL
jgi:hypothetical protein